MRQGEERESEERERREREREPQNYSTSSAEGADPLTAPLESDDWRMRNSIRTVRELEEESYAPLSTASSSVQKR